MKNVFVAIAFALSMISLGIAIQKHRFINVYAAHGVDTTARLVESEAMDPSRRGESFTYEFTDTRGQRHTFDLPSRHDSGRRRRPDTERSIRYLRDDPATFVQHRLGIDSLDDMQTYWAIQKIILTVLAFLFGFLTWLLHKMDREEFRERYARFQEVLRESDF